MAYSYIFGKEKVKVIVDSDTKEEKEKPAKRNLPTIVE